MAKQGRNENLIQSRQLTLSTTEWVFDRLHNLVVDVGGYGKNRAEAAERILEEALRTLATTYPDIRHAPKQKD